MDFVTGSCEAKDMEIADIVQLEDNSIVKTHGMIYSIKNMGDFAKVNEIYAKYFTGVYPARSCVEVARLPKDVLIEIEAVAIK